MPQTQRTPWIGPLTDAFSHARSSAGLGLFILCVIYAVGLVGILIPIHPDFIRLTPANLLVSAFLVLAYHRPWSLAFALFVAVCYTTGFVAEWFGVQTGLLFGEYVYGEVLGPKWEGTPLLIGVNWVLLTYGSAMVCQTIGRSWHWVWKALASAMLMVLLDLIIEPVAIQQGFWSWSGGDIPLQNYLGWFVVALPLQLLYHRYIKARTNPVAIALLGLQFLFFGTLALFG